MAKTAAEPLSLWLMRQYMQTNEIRLGHTPSLALLSQDDGKRNVQGWHSDFPYLWGISRSIDEERHPITDGRVPTPSGPTVLGIQRNVCISPFTSVGGATAFKLGSHARDQGPPRQWGNGSDHSQPGYRAEHGLPYSGPEADIVEAPGGSIILYDSRTWHRAGVNRTDKRRSAMLQAMIPGYMLPFMDTSGPYKSFKQSDAYQELSNRERDELRRLMIHYIAGPLGRHAITTDAELTGELNESIGPARSAY
jgi:ectoine hydroxylase-related dioxygenase (phytanoyl-CoA dioxygenase family)